MREELAHLILHLFNCEILAGVLVYLVGELSAMVNHLFHCRVLQESAVLVAVNAVILVLCAVGICAEDIICERYSAALTEFHFHSSPYILRVAR